MEIYGLQTDLKKNKHKTDRGMKKFIISFIIYIQIYLSVHL